MQKKIVIGMVLFAFLVLLAMPNSAKANTTETTADDTKYSSITDFMHKNGYTTFEAEDGYKYLVTLSGDNYKVYKVKGEEPFFGVKDNTSVVYLIGDRNSKVPVDFYYNPTKAKEMNNYAIISTNGGTNNRYTYFPEVGQNWGITSWTWSEKFPDVVYSELNIYKVTENIANSYTYIPDYTTIYFESSNKLPEPEIPDIETDLVDKSLKLQSITEDGFYYNNVYYEWNSSQKAYMILENLTDYLVFYDDYNKQLIFVWAFDDFMAQAKNQKSGLRFYSYYYEFITEPNNSSVLPYCLSVYQINSDGTLDCINSLQNEKAEDNHQFSFGWTNPIYEPQLDNIDNFSTYEEYVLNNNLIASNCDIYNNSGVLVKSAVTLNNDLITPDEVPDTEIGSLKYYLYEKLPIIRTVEVFVKKFNVVLEAMKESGEPPEIIMNFDNYYGFGGEVNVLDVSWYEDYREPVKAILSAILIIPFILWVYKKGLPEAIGGI